MPRSEQGPLLHLDETTIVKKIDVSLLRSTPMPEKLTLAEYKDARTFLNICELIAVGVNKGAFSESVSKAYWGDVLPNAY